MFNVNNVLVYPGLNNLNSTPALLSTSLANNDPWAATSTSNNLPLNNSSLLPINNSNILATPVSQNSIAQNDPWAAFNASTVTPTANSNFKDVLATPKTSIASNGIDLLSNNITTTPIQQGQQRANVKTPEKFLGENSSLVNLDNLMGPTALQLKPGNFKTV